MPTKKIYAVRKGRTPGLYTSWPHCRMSVSGFPGAEYRSFADPQEAIRYLEEGKVPAVWINVSQEQDDSGHQPAFLAGNLPIEPIPGTLIAYVDGSYEHTLKKYGFGCIFILPGGQVYTEKGSGDNPESAQLRNVTGEMLGAMFAVRWAMENGFERMEIRYDYEGIEKWVTGAWRAKTELTGKYARAMQGWGTRVELHFAKVTAHANIFFNELADRLAKEAVAGDAVGIPKVRRLEEMDPWNG